MKEVPKLAVGDRVRVMATATNQAAGLANLRGVVLHVESHRHRARVQLRDREEPLWFEVSGLMKEEITIGAKR